MSRSEAKEYEVKTMLSEGQYKAMLEVIAANGMTQAGFLRNLIVREIYESRDLVSQIAAICERAKSARKSP